MTIGSVEVGGALVACTGIFTMIISKIKCYYKRPWCLCACIDSKEHELLNSTKSDSDKSSNNSDSKSDIFFKNYIYIRWILFLL